MPMPLRLQSLLEYLCEGSGIIEKYINISHIPFGDYVRKMS